MAVEMIMAVGGPIFLGVVIALTQFLKWPSWMNYVWAALSIIWGIVALSFF